MAILATIALSSTATAQAPRQTGTASMTTVLAIPATGFRDNTPVGIFCRLKVGFSSGSRLDVNTLAFLPGNRVTRTYPFGGGDSFDQQKRSNPDMCGSYRAGENTISIRWHNNQASDYTYRRADDGFELDGDIYRRQ